MADEAHVRHLAHLARLRLDDDEVAALADEVPRILAAFEDLPAGEHVEEATPPEDEGRPDEAAPAPPEQVEAILDQVPHVRDRHVSVPRGGT